MLVLFLMSFTNLLFTLSAMVVLTSVALKLRSHVTLVRHKEILLTVDFFPLVWFCTSFSTKNARTNYVLI
jgi:hypothetical protein